MDTVLAFQNADVLRAIHALAAGATPPAIVNATGRDKSNLHKTLARLDAAGIIRREPWLQVTEAAMPILKAADIAEGLAPAPPEGFTSAFHGQICPDALNPRLDLDSEDFKESLDELRQDILQNGLLQNLVVRSYGDICGWNIELNGQKLPLYRLVSGERRWRAIGQAIADGDWDQFRPLPIQIIETDDHGHRLRALAENLQRRALTPLEEAKAFQGLIADGMDTQDIADAVSMSRRNVQLRLQLLELSSADQTRLELPKEDENHLTIRDAKKKLQKPKVEAAPVGPKAEDLTIFARLVLVEALHLVTRADRNTGYYKAEVGPKAEAEGGLALKTLTDLSLMNVSGPHYETGRFSIQVYGHAHHWVQTVYGGKLEDPKFLARVLKEVRTEYASAVLHDEAAAKDLYFSGWMNGPFDLSPEGQAIFDAKEAERIQAEAQAADKAQQEAEEADRSRRMVVSAVQLASLPPAAAWRNHGDQVAALLAENGAPLPWTVNEEGELVDANDKPLLANKDGRAARRLIIAMGVNTLAGLRTDANRIRLPTTSRKADHER